jgi:RNA ligase
MHFLNTSNPFPVITNQEQFAANIGDKEEIRFMTQDNGFIVCSYVVSMESTFDNEYARECRGIVFNKDGEVVSRPLSKFFNVNEKPTTHADLLPWDQVVRVMDKRDGSMIHTVNVGDASPFDPDNPEGAQPDGKYTFDIKSKKSFKSDVANDARKFLSERRKYRDFCEYITKIGMTAIFEWTSPTARIVLSYKQEELKLLHLRNNTTGEYASLHMLNTLANQFGILMVDEVNLDGDNFVLTTKGEPIKYTLTKDRPIFEQFQELGETLTDTEGWIFQFANGDMVKLKTKDYMSKHRAMTFLRERDIALLVIDETLDDLKALLVGEGVDITEINEIERDVVTYIEQMISDVEAKFAEVTATGMTKKDAALRFGPAGEKFEFFGQLMKKMDGAEPDYKDHYRKRVLPNIPLRQLMQSTAEAE